MAVSSPRLAVEAHDLTKTFRGGWLRRRRTEALRGASLEVPRGAIFGLLGPNGAGKTTLLSILATLVLPDSGSARILGFDVVREAREVRKRLNMASGNASFVWSLRPPEVLTFYGRLYGLHGRALRERVESLIELTELGPHRKTEYNELSTGLKQRLAFAKALLNEPEVLWAVATRFQADQDLAVIPNALGAHLDPTAFDITRLKHGAMSTKLIIDATKPAPPTDFPKRALVPADVVEQHVRAEQTFVVERRL